MKSKTYSQEEVWLEKNRSFDDGMAHATPSRKTIRYIILLVGIQIFTSVILTFVVLQLLFN